MSNSEVQVIAPGLIKENGEFIYDPKKVAEEGTKRGITVITETAKDRKNKFNEGLVKEIHRKVAYYLPQIAGVYRGDEDVRLGKHRLVRGQVLKDRMYKFGTWLEEEVEGLKDRPEDLLGALRVACEAHYGLVSPQLHPFYDGNGRVARLLANGILMLNAHEFMFYGIRILPVPLVRQTAKGKDPYIEILNRANTTGTLNEFEVYIASLWLSNIRTMMSELNNRAKGKNNRTQGDRSLIGKFENRIEMLDSFIKEQTKPDSKNSRPYLVPDYFEINFLYKDV
ncbi:hypothetical protein A3B45_03840 [Candidatus Daviesbacteria bacterium RIFCSPLOWO2_01_FULL_39_12]|uniref:Fido domain-containing protein n=1 Tax=Candidatus Daviesbacteria bacterium RIFCSPLOWO2_01_FULL_39_12 TaxID=1797785 RepID=A0A1F5KU66_9BACT|nr:MAG: hypothetical protein A3B45_03840 [Candidatus Daviesbacteria bacterium RIFCSPLOWO2_01_FULL_39_12]